MYGCELITALDIVDYGRWSVESWPHWGVKWVVYTAKDDLTTHMAMFWCFDSDDAFDLDPWKLRVEESRHWEPTVALETEIPETEIDCTFMFHHMATTYKSRLLWMSTEKGPSETGRGIKCWLFVLETMSCKY